MRPPTLSWVLVLLLAVVHGVQAAWPDGPFSSSGRWIVNTRGEHVTYAGVNWPGAGETMIPEGLQYQSISTIVSKIGSLGMNVIRLTFAIEMIDGIFDNGADVTIADSMARALGTENGQRVFDLIVEKNPQFNSATTRLEVFDAIAAECLVQRIYVHLDNHVSKAKWCCGTNDGNAWFGDEYFDVEKWKRGLQYMAVRGAKWGNMMSIGMRNELRNSGQPSYGWSNWYTNMVAAANAISSVNGDTLIFFSGLNYDTTLSAVAKGSPLGDGKVFRKTDFTFQNKIVLELHDYQSAYDPGLTCSNLESSLLDSGFDALEADVENQLPVLMTEWGHSQTDNLYKSPYASCLRSFLPKQKAGWMVWVIAGSYYIRSGVQDFEEPWGLLNHDWSDWRSQDAIDDGIRPMVNATLASWHEENGEPHRTGLAQVLRKPSPDDQGWLMPYYCHKLDRSWLMPYYCHKPKRRVKPRVNFCVDRQWQDGRCHSSN